MPTTINLPSRSPYLLSNMINIRRFIFGAIAYNRDYTCPAYQKNVNLKAWSIFYKLEL
ncbi:hypothetical protein [Planktothricoides raciborskii]|uniref:Uncharacterized protein n=1 Tax=Planktothricoides raciborskii FACHB-1370 TaxID=2949576 RepID=A0ABR8EFR4_9CYAN|nr:hypothetical protein [Planktothricoides raciborskii]MBD2545689.1 hypothetical protein [Planktothricoides raciborskii FACHB-1370]MBD2582739.1 hypothetical protein [Planktothricoides raciborskii FACHB-1261]